MTNLDTARDDSFHGDNRALISSIKALLILDQKGTLVPHGIGGLARDLLHSASIRLARAEAEGWRPIESAPRDGSKIMLGYIPDEEHEFGFVGQGRWWPSDDDGPDNMGHDAGFMDCDFEFFQCGRSFGNPDYMGRGLQPTHWQPLPSPPKEDGE